MVILAKGRVGATHASQRRRETWVSPTLPQNMSHRGTLPRHMDRMFGQRCGLIGCQIFARDNVGVDGEQHGI